MVLDEEVPFPFVPPDLAVREGLYPVLSIVLGDDAVPSPVEEVDRRSDLPWVKAPGALHGTHVVNKAASAAGECVG